MLYVFYIPELLVFSGIFSFVYFAVRFADLLFLDRILLILYNKNTDQRRICSIPELIRRFTMKYRKPLWIVLTVIGAVCIPVALGMLLFRAIGGTLTVISAAALAFIAVAGGIMVYFALRTVLNLPKEAEASGTKKQRKPAVSEQNALCTRIEHSLSKYLTLFILLLSAVIFLFAYDKAQQVASIPQSAVHTGTFYETAEVLSIDGGAYQGQQDVEDVPIGNQIVTVEIKSGDFTGSRFQLENDLSYLYGTVLKVGDDVVVSYSVQNGAVDGIEIQDYNRTFPLIWVILLFLVVTVLVGGKIGAKSLLGLALTILCLFSVLIPLLLGGAPTLPMILGLCSFVTVVEFVILGGVNRKTICAILGTISGVAFAMLFGLLAGKILRVNGFLMYSADPYIEPLLQIKQGQPPFASLQIGDLLVGGILIAALGAVNDVAMSISSAMNELIAVNPNLTRKELFKSGMNIGRDMVGTMTNTLILALAGSSFVLMIYLSSLEPSFAQLMSSTFFSVEMVQALSSSIGVILAVPFSVLIGMLLFGHTKKAAKKVK